jgi:hypothetical protein
MIWLAVFAVFAAGVCFGFLIAALMVAARDDR